MKDSPFPIGFLKKIGKWSDYEEELGEEEIFEEKKEDLPFFKFFIITSILILLTLVLRLLQLQISQGAYHRFLAEGNRIRFKEIPAPRGIISDSKGKILAGNNVEFSLELYPFDLPKKEIEQDSLFQKINKITGISVEELKKKVAQNIQSPEPIVLANNIDYLTALRWQIEAADLPLTLVKRPRRYYLPEKSLSHILGFLGKISQKELEAKEDYRITSLIGKSGLELWYEDYIKGQDGREEVEVDPGGKVVRELSLIPTQSGNNLTLFLDYNLQEKMAQALSEKLLEIGAKNGVVIALNPQTGAILGLVSLPSFDNNLFGKNISQQKIQALLQEKTQPFLNRAIAGFYPPGSAIKPVIAATALEERVVTPSTTIVDPGEIRLGNWVFPDWKAHGVVDLKKAIAQSCNVFFYSIGGGWGKIKGLGVEKISQYLKAFDFGKKLGIDLPGEKEGFVPQAEWKKKEKRQPWYIGDTYHLSIGQGDLLVTPIQLLVATSAIANGGKLYKPQIVQKITDPEGKEIKKFEPEVIGTVPVSEQNLKEVREGMRQAVTAGSAAGLADLPFEVAGKTGTAQFGKPGKTHAWFIGFSPYQAPEISVLVLIEGGGEGYAVAVPVARKIFQYYFSQKP